MKTSIKYYTLLALFALLLVITVIGAIQGNVLLSIIFGIMTMVFGIILLIIYAIDKSFSFFNKLDDHTNKFWDV